MMRLDVLHRTEYRFSQPLVDVIQLLRLTPLSCLTQTVLDWRIDVDCDARLRESRDGYGNVVHMLYVNEPVTSLTIKAAGKVITDNRSGVVEGLPSDLPAAVFLRPTALTLPDPALRALATEVKCETPLATLHALNALLFERLVFDAGSTTAATPAATAFHERRGVCQDFAHIFIAVARAADIPARYVSGHLLRRDGSGPQPASHAWVEAWVEGLGWVAFDPTNGICADEAYIRVAAGLDYSEAAPLAGARRGGGTEDMTVVVEVKSAKRGQRQAPCKQRKRAGARSAGDGRSRSGHRRRAARLSGNPARCDGG